jgi:hypothetical protein
LVLAVRAVVTTAVIVALARRTLEREFKNPVLDYERELYDELITICADNHPAAFAAAFERGEQMSYDEIIENALSDRA